MKKIFLLFGLMIILVGYIHSAQATNYGLRQVAINQAFELAMSEVVQVGDYPIRIKFEGLSVVDCAPGYTQCGSDLAGIEIFHPFGSYKALIAENEVRSYQGASLKVVDIDGNSVTILLSASEFPHNPGTNIRTSDGTIWFINSEYQRQPYTSAGAFLSYGFNQFSLVANANGVDLFLPVGSFVPPADGKVICSDRGTDKGTCYLITEGMKAGFVSSQVFTALGYRFNRVLSGDVSFLPVAPVIFMATERHRTGALINNQGTVGYVTGNGYVLFPSPAVFDSWGFSFEDVIPANKDDNAALSNLGTLADRQAYQLSPNPIGGGAPTVDLKINGSDSSIEVLEGSDLSITWTSSNATDCGFAGAGNLFSGSEINNAVSLNGQITVENVSRGLNNHNEIILSCVNNTVTSSTPARDKIFVDVVVQ